MKLRHILDKPTPTLDELAKRHKVTKSFLQAQLKLGVEVEQEHTSDLKVATEIALDHLGEDPKYYIKLAKVEEGLMKRSDPYISGEVDTPLQKLAHDKRLDTLAKRAHLSSDQVSKIWAEERDKVDPKHPQRWSIVMNNVMKRLNVA